MAGLILELDAASSNPDGTSPGTALLLTDTANGWALLEFDPGVAEPEYQLASSVDTEGGIPVSGRHQNRTVTLQLHLARSSAALLRASLDTLGQKVFKVFREGGTLKLTLPDASVRIFDLVGADHGLVFNKRFVNSTLAEVTLRLPAGPYMRGAESDLGDNTETTLPCLVFTEASVAGDVDALGRLVIDEDQAVDQWWLTWGLESLNYSSSANAALFYQAEGRTAMSGSAIAAGPTGASGAGSNVMRNTALLTTYQAIMSTQATAAGAHLSHVGTFRVYARAQAPTTNTGVVSVALEWGEGDFRRFTQNATQTVATQLEGAWVLLDLGLVTLTKVTAGTQRWEGRVLAKSTVAGDDIDIDHLMLVPVAEGSGVVTAIVRSPSPTSLAATDEFTGTTAGNVLNARVAPTGGTWATSGATSDFVFSDQVITGGSGEPLARPTSGSVDSGNGRFAILGSTNYSGAQLRASVARSAGTNGTQYIALVARYVDASNYLRLLITAVSGGPLQLEQTVAGVSTVIATSSTSWSLDSLRANDVELVVQGDTAYGSVSGGLGGAPVTVTGSSAALGSGGALSTGKPGVNSFIGGTGSPAGTHYVDNFTVASLPSDAAVFASQSIEIRHDRVVREDSGGTLWVTPSSYEGDYLRVPPSGAEGRTTRVIVKASRNGQGTGADSGIDDISARLFVTPRYL